ncbi:MAG TPA: peptidyl-prolyl cis-trans isomerase [Acidisarcina sp.]
MIRFLQQDSRIIKYVFIGIIAVAVITMVVSLIPGIFQDQASAANTYATVNGAGPFGRFLGASTDITTSQVQERAAMLLQRQGLPESASLIPLMMPQAAQTLIGEAVLLQEADKLGLKASDEDVRQFLHTGQFGQAIFPNGNYIGDQQYAALIDEHLHITRDQFEAEVKKQIEEERLRAYVTGPVTVSDKEIRDSYKQQGTKIKFDYAVLSSDDLGKQINPTDADLQTFFQKNSGRYANAVPAERKLQYLSFNSTQIPGSGGQITEAAVQSFYNQHQADYKLEDQVRVRHILIKVEQGASPQADAAARQKAGDLLKQIKAGANFSELAAKNSDDPGSKTQGGELGFLKHGATVPEFDQAAFSLQPGQTSDLIHTKFGYHILQVEEKQTAHTKSLDEVKPQIIATLMRDGEAKQAQNFAQQLASEAGKNGLQKTAEAHHLQAVTTDYLPQGGIVPGLADSTKLLADAFSAKPGAAPQVASTGEGFAVFQVLDVKSAHAPTFAEYKTHIAEDYKQEQLPQLLASKTTELAARAHSENDLAKAAKEVGATFKSSDLVGRDGQVPDIGQISSAAPELFTLNVGQVSSPINTGRTGVVARLTAKQEPSSDEIAKNFDQTRESVLDQRREESFAVFASTLVDQFTKSKRIRMNQKAQSPAMPGAPNPLGQ